MPRIARVVAVDYPHHIIQRGNNRQKTFFTQAAREKYLALLKEYVQKWKASVLAYCLMSNHVHLLIRPQQPESLAKVMQGVNLRYTQYINKRYRRTGRLWESRYHSCIVDEEAYLWAVARYIEQNPVRAGIVKRPEKYPYSSARAHVSEVEDKTLGEELFAKEEKQEYITFITAAASEQELTQIRKSTKTGKPLGKVSFVKKIGRILKRDFKIKPSRKPRK